MFVNAPNRKDKRFAFNMLNKTSECVIKEPFNPGLNNASNHASKTNLKGGPVCSSRSCLSRPRQLYFYETNEQLAFLCQSYKLAVLSYSPPDLPDKIELNLKGVPRIVQHGGRYWT